ncbi:polysaccharide deacetylase family protein [Archaeoglobus neptunius]|uniref:polysaccharide deacetylase family protein n=1 Tax=Archaeoglobus neptunius TaxID=2798580 RepID=UPI001927602A|nr:polysaccharide deacetylase family protein [Archaeoglobus neptunius]
MDKEDIFMLHGIKHFEMKYKVHPDGQLLNGCSSIDFARDTNVFGWIGRVLSGHIEEHYHSKNSRKEISREPFLDIVEKRIFDAILNENREKPVVRHSFWPHGKKFALLLTHDVDEVRKTYQYLTYPARHLRRRNFRAFKNQIISFVKKLGGKEPFWTFEEIMQIEMELGVRSTFFFLNETAKVNLLDTKTWRHYGRKFNIRDKKITELLKTLTSGGWEVGLHGSFESYRDFKKLKNELMVLEEVLGEKVCGTRQHNLNLEIPETWKYHEKLGLIYDTTLGFNSCAGFRWGTSFPFHPLDAESGRALDLLEIPLVVEDIALFSYEKPWKEFLEIARKVESYEGVLTILWHHSVFNDLEFPEWGDMYRKIVEYCLNRDAWVATGCEIARWWREREISDVRVDYGEGEITIRPVPAGRQHFLDIHIEGDAEIEYGAEVVKREKDRVTILTTGDEVRVVF